MTDLARELAESMKRRGMTPPATPYAHIGERYRLPEPVEVAPSDRDKKVLTVDCAGGCGRRFATRKKDGVAFCDGCKPRGTHRESRHSAEDVAAMRALREAGHEWAEVGAPFECSAAHAATLVNGRKKPNRKKRAL